MSKIDRPPCQGRSIGGFSQRLDQTGYFQYNCHKYECTCRVGVVKRNPPANAEMPEYHRYYRIGGTYFFTVVTYRRYPVFREESVVDLLRDCFSLVKNIYPFSIDAIVILPDHLHTIWTLPEKDSDFSTRWKLIKSTFSKQINKSYDIRLRESLFRKGESGIWQRRFWEHLIRGQEDFNSHCDYIHYNPVKHGLVKSPSEWKYSSFNKYVERGLYEPDWGISLETRPIDMNLE
jgi:putative transposase